MLAVASGGKRSENWQKVEAFRLQICRNRGHARNPSLMRSGNFMVGDQI